MRQQLDTAIRLSLAAQVRNRFAWILLVAFVPVWYLLIGSMISHTGAEFRLRATGAALVVDGHDLTLITAGLSAITLITGFVVFAAVRRSLPFDRRLVLSGYLRTAAAPFTPYHERERATRAERAAAFETEPMTRLPPVSSRTTPSTASAPHPRCRIARPPLSPTARSSKRTPAPRYSGWRPLGYRRARRKSGAPASTSLLSLISAL